MHERIDHRVKQIMADLFSLPPDLIQGETSPESVESWDSLNHLNMVLALEQAFGVEFRPEEIEHLQSFGQICTTLQEKMEGVPTDVH